MIWTILGVSVGVVAIFCVVVSELFVGTPAFEEHRPHAAIVLSILGGIAWFLGRYLAGRRRPADDAAESKSFVLLDLRYWGPMFVVFGVIVIFIQTLRARPEVAVQARTAPAPVAVPEPPPPAPLPKPTNAPVVFPKLKLQGVMLKTGNPMIIIDGRSYGIGDEISGVVVKEINRDGVVLEKQGEIRTLSLD